MDKRNQERLDERTARAKRDDAPCVCERHETAYEENPTGHRIECPRWGTLLPNDSQDRHQRALVERWIAARLYIESWLDKRRTKAFCVNSMQLYFNRQVQKWTASASAGSWANGVIARGASPMEAEIALAEALRSRVTSGAEEDSQVEIEQAPTYAMDIQQAGEEQLAEAEREKERVAQLDRDFIDGKGVPEPRRFVAKGQCYRKVTHSMPGATASEIVRVLAEAGPPGFGVHYWHCKRVDPGKAFGTHETISEAALLNEYDRLLDPKSDQ